jgi:DNA-binding NtrC family response regulator
MPDISGPMPRGGVLVVDDEEPIRRAIKRRLVDAGYDPLFEAANGTQALSVLEANADAILVVLLDLRMPEMDGMEVMKHLVNVHRVPVGVIVVTAHSEVMAAAQFFKLGTASVIAADYVVKPVELDFLLHEVERTVAQILAKRQQVRRSATSELNDIVSSRLDRIEAELHRLVGRERSFVAELGLDLIRALVIAAALFALLSMGVSDFVHRLMSH